MWRLRVVLGAAVPAFVRVTDGLALGRSADAGILFRDPLVSRIHARIAMQGDEVWIVDVGSANGTLVNGERVDRARLAAGDRVTIGDADLVFEPDDGTQPEPDADALRGLARLARTTVRLESSVRIPGGGAALTGITVAETVSGDANLSRFERFALGACRFANADAGWVLVRTVAGGPALVAGGFPASGPHEGSPVPRALLAQAVRDGEALLLAREGPDAADAARLSRRGSVLCAPIGGGASAAVLCVERHDPERPFTDRDLVPFATFASQAASSLAPDVDWFRWRRLALAAASPGSDAALVGQSAAFLSMLDVADHVAAARSPLLLRGEPGTGRRLLARFIHEEGRGPRRPFVVVPCAALPPGAETAALFGAASGPENGAASPGRQGLVEDAANGTLCLAEIGDLARAAQGPLADALVAGAYRQDGSGDLRDLRCRIIATTSRNLDPLAAAGDFHGGLATALAGLAVGVPPLADRLDDVPLLAGYFAALHGMTLRGRPFRLTERAAAALRTRRLPGNVAELSALVESAAVRASGTELDAADLERQGPAEPDTVSADLSLDAAERAAIVRALDAARGRRGKAAEILGISWPTLTRKIREYGIG